MRRSVSGIAVVLLSVGALTACTSAGGSATSAAGSGEVDFQSSSGRLPAAQDRSATSSGGSSGSGGAAQQAAADRSVVTTGSLRLIAEKPIQVADRVQALVQQAGGSVARASEDPSGRPTAQLTLRIPSDAFPRVLAAIEEEGDEVRDVTIDATDVTSRVTDYAVRIANLRTSIARLQGLLRQADSSAALVEIEGALTARQTSLEQLLAQQRTLSDQVASATLTVAVVTPAAAPKKTGPGDFPAAVATGAAALAAFAGAAAIGFGLALPWLAVLALLGGAAVAVRRGLRRRHRPTSA